MVSFTLIITEAPYGKERAFSGLRFGMACVVEGHKIRIFLIENGIYVAKKEQKPHSDSPNFGRYLEDLIEAGAEVKACIVCVESRGLKENDFIKGVKMATMLELVEWSADSDKLIVF